ncbi:hypothetical protein B9Q06_09325 [Candidatus Marsarchaeota G2 archaeon ECH_B_2]|jgi:hypothetical protein|uniref:Uncharacterized protein n=3 Tax=Candidatus Marsarchaeota group 2 TaxID=2203771 RepID=A0A2R6B6X5_9ARCH|nr:MAG: hypothetical protein B9Q06_09325 [Candidatus Marsarchaeota G2 archaeon ECH_B_2]PSN98829.1 MAG: hypothetical protein B9Q07_08470 [Candidatus Marsarchaeota G2 archaeon ECH_B_3]PSO00831.1 MAG: hypothetical protein B9Q05_09760 [Candidatus Marsarchaeota G2 archaeon ECH_B_1]
MSTENPDIKGKVEESRDNFKKLELLIPGLRGYRQREDVRVADELLRNQMADRLDRARASLESLRRKVVGAGGLLVARPGWLSDIPVAGA